MCSKTMFSFKFCTVLILLTPEVIEMNEILCTENLLSFPDDFFTQDVVVIGSARNNEPLSSNPTRLACVQGMDDLGASAVQNILKHRSAKPISYLNSDSTRNWTSTVQQLKASSGMPLAIVIATDDPFSILKEFGKPISHPLLQIFIVANKKLEQSIVSMSSLLSEYLDLNGDVYLVSPGNFTTGNMSTEISIVEMYAYKNRTFFQPVTTETWKLSYNEILRKAPRRRNFRKSPVIGTVSTSIGIGRDNAYYAEVNSSTGEVTFISGFRVEEFFNMRDALNLTAVGMQADGFANLGPDGKLTGIGKQVVEGTADLSVPSSEMTMYRLKELTFLHPSSANQLYAYFKQLPATSWRDIYFQAFQEQVWIVYLAVWAVFALVVMVFIWLWKCCLGYDGHQSVLSCVLECILFTVGVVCQQGCFKLSRPGPKVLKIVFLTGILTSFVLYTAYCGSLVSSLSTPFAPISSFQDILVRRFHIYGMSDILATRPMIKFLQTQHTWLNGPNYHGGESPFINATCALPEILNSKSAVLANGRTIHGYWEKSNISDQLLCSQVSRVPIGGQLTKTAMFIKKGSPLKEVLNHHILQMFERGMRHRIETRYLRTARFNCLRTNSDSLKVRLGLNDVCTAIVILTTGFILSFVIFCLEKIVGGMRRNGKFPF